MKNFKIAGIVGFCALLAGFSLVVNTNVAHAQGTPASCVVLTSDFGYNSDDASTKGEVSILQRFLVLKGYLSANSVNGNFGPATLAAVQRFQSDHSISASGLVGPNTRGFIKNSTCGIGTLFSSLGTPMVLGASTDVPNNLGSNGMLAPEISIQTPSNPTISGTVDPSGATTAMTATFLMYVTAQGGMMTEPVANDFKVVFIDSSGRTYTASSVNVVTVPNSNIANGSTGVVTVTAQIPNSVIPSSGLFTAAITAFHWTIAGVSTTQLVGLGSLVTPTAFNFVKTGGASNAPVLRLTSTPTIQSTGVDQFGKTTALTSTFSFNVTSVGGTTIKPASGDFAVLFTAVPTGAQYPASNVSVATVPNSNIANGSTGVVTVTAQALNSALPSSGLYEASISNINWNVGGQVITVGPEALSNFLTPTPVNFVKSQNAPSIQVPSTPTIQVSGTTSSGATTALTATFSLNVTPQGGSMTEPVSSDFGIVFTDASGHTYIPSSMNVVTVPNNQIAQGSTARLTVTAQIMNSALSLSGPYTASITSFRSNIAGNSMTQTTGLTGLTTPVPANFVKGGSAIPTISSIVPMPGPSGTLFVVGGTNLGGLNNIEILSNTAGQRWSAEGANFTATSFVFYPPSSPALPAGTYVLVVSNASGNSNPFLFTLSAQATASLSLPTASLTEITPISALSSPVGTHNTSVNIGIPVSFMWSSTNADRFSSVYKVTAVPPNGPHGSITTVCGPTGAPAWIANTAAGQLLNFMFPSSYSGCAYTFTYTATKSSTGASASDSVNLKVN